MDVAQHNRAALQLRWAHLASFAPLLFRGASLIQWDASKGGGNGQKATQLGQRIIGRTQSGCCSDVDETTLITHFLFRPCMSFQQVLVHQYKKANKYCWHRPGWCEAATRPRRKSATRPGSRAPTETTNMETSCRFVQERTRCRCASRLAPLVSSSAPCSHPSWTQSQAPSALPR